MRKNIKRSMSMVLSLLMIASSIIVHPAYADVAPEPNEDLYKEWGSPVVQLDNGTIRVTSDKQTGRFIAETISGLPNKSADDYKDLLYGNRFESPETSYTSVKIDGEDFIYGNDYGFLGLQGHYTVEPYVDSDTNSIISQWSINDIVVTQRLKLTNNPKLATIGSVFVSYDIVNNGNAPKSVGLRMLLDTKIGTVDSPALTIPGGGFIYKEKEFIGDEIPSSWYAYDQYITPQIIALGTVSGEGLSKPDKLQFAAWGDVSQTKWDYAVNPEKPIIEVRIDGVLYEGENGIYPPDGAVVDYAAKDSCAVMYWEPELLNQGETKIIDTSYGVGDASIKDSDPGYRISLQGTDKLNMNKEKSSYTTEYVNAEFNVDNNFDNSKNIANFQIELELPDELMLVEGEQKTVLKELKAGTYHRSMWKIEPVVQEDFTISAYSVLLRAEGLPVQRITKVLIMEGKQAGMPAVSFLDSTPKKPFYYEDTSRNVFINGSGFDSFGSAIGQVMEATLIQETKKYSLDFSTFKKISDTVISVGIPDNLPSGTYDLFVSVSDATGNKNDQKTFKQAVEISDDIKYSLNLVSEIKFPIVMIDDGYNTIEEEINIYGKFIDNKNGTYTSKGADEDNPVRINNTLKYAGGTLTINTDPTNAFIEASEGILWCDIINERNKTAAQAIIASSGFRFEAASGIGDNDTFVRMVYDIDKAYSDTMYDVSYQSVPITLDTVTITSEGIDIKGSMGILNPLTYGTNDFIPEEIDLDSLSLGFYKAEVDNISISQDGMDIEGKFNFEMPFAISLVAGSKAVLEINTREEHLVIEAEVSIGKMMSKSVGAKARIGLRKGRFDEIYIGARFPKPIIVSPPIPIGITGFGGGLSNLSFAGAFPITIIIGVFIKDTTGLEAKGYNLLTAEGEISMSPFHLEGEAEADLYMIDLAEVYTKFVWKTWDPDIEKRGIIVDAVIHYKIFNGKVYIQYLEGESFLGRGELAVAVPQEVAVIGGLEVAGVIVEVTEYSIAGSIYALEQDVGVRYYFPNGRTEFLEMKEELENSNHGLILEYDDDCITQYGFNYAPIEFTQHADADSQFITELNLTNNSNVMLILRMTEEQFNNLNENSIKVIKPGTDGLTTVKYIDNAALLKSDGSIKSIDEFGLGENEIIAVKQLINNAAAGLSNEYLVTIPIASPKNGLWTIITNGSMELLPYSTMKNSEITEFSASFNSTNNTLTANWKLDGEPDKFRFYVVNADEVSEQELNNPASLWGKGSLLYGQTVTTKDYTDLSGNTVQVEDEIIYTPPTKDGILGTYNTGPLNLSTGSYYVYAKTDKENTVPDYAVSKVEVLNYNTPYAPSGLAIKDIGNNKISISWDADYNMDEYYIYRKNAANETYDLSSPLCIYKVYDPLDYAPNYDNWPGNLPRERMDKFEVVVDGDILDPDKPENKTYYFDLRAVGKSTMGMPSLGSVFVKVPEEIISYTEFKSADSKIFYKPYVEKDLDGIEHRYYKYVTSSPNIIISGMSNIPVRYSIQRDGNILAATGNFAMNYSEKITLKEGINYFIITYKNEHGDTLVEEYMAEYDNKAPSLVVLEPKEGTVTQNGKITVTGVTDPYAVVTVNNVNYDADVDGNFSIALDFGNSFLTKIKLEARDSVNNVTTREISVLNDQAKVEDITVVPEYKLMTTGTKQQLSTYISSNDDLGEKIENSSVKYSIVQGSQFASIDEKGVVTAKYEGVVVAKSEFFLTDTVSLSDSIVIDVDGDKYHGSAKYYPPIFSRDMFTWLVGSSMSTNGGTIKTDDGVILFVPSGALPYYQDNIDILTYNDNEDLVNEMNIPQGAMASSIPYFINLVTDFVKPAQLTLPVSGFNNAFVYYYDEELGALIYKGGVMSPDNKSVTADITRPGTYIALNYPLQSIFTDIPSNYWGYDYVYGLNYLDVINGYNDETLIFKPDGKITRAEFIKLLVASQHINLSEAEDLELNFADIENIPDWALPYIKAAVMHGLVNGKNIDGKLYISAGDFITREELATIIGRAIDSDSTNGKIFNDSSQISSWAAVEIQKLVELGIINGYEDNTFKPRNNAARVEAAVMIFKTLIQ
ncbi:MAG: S-layer homology domain-containing protein [Sedimentibacter sp.]